MSRSRPDGGAAGGAHSKEKEQKNRWRGRRPQLPRARNTEDRVGKRGNKGEEGEAHGGDKTQGFDLCTANVVTIILLGKREGEAESRVTRKKKTKQKNFRPVGESRYRRSVRPSIDEQSCIVRRRNNRAKRANFEAKGGCPG